MGDSARATAARAKALREGLEETVVKQNRALTRRNDLRESIRQGEQAAAQDRLEAKTYRKNAADLETEARQLRTQAAEATRQGRDRDAEDFNEQADVSQRVAKTAVDAAKLESEKADRHTAQVAKLKAEEVEQTRIIDNIQAHFGKAEAAVDTLENKARILQDAESKYADAARLEKQAAATKDPAAAEQLRHDAEGARIVAEAARSTADGLKVDEQAIKAVGLNERVAASEPDAILNSDGMDTASANAAAPERVAWDASTDETPADDPVGDEGLEHEPAGDLSPSVATVAAEGANETDSDSNTEADDYDDYTPTSETQTVASYSEADQGQTFEAEDTFPLEQQSQIDEPSPEESGPAVESEEWPA